MVLCNCSTNVKILFSAIYNTVNDIAQDIWIFQGWDISTQLREIVGISPLNINYVCILFIFYRCQQNLLGEALQKTDH